MRVLLRADASPEEGTGHVMRCLTLASELRSEGHDVQLAISVRGLPWLEAVIEAQAFNIRHVEAHSLLSATISDFSPDWIVVDSYRIPAAAINASKDLASVLVIVDGDTRGVDADLYLDPNLGAESHEWGCVPASKLLAGAKYALVRHSISQFKRTNPWRFLQNKATIIAVMGGSDPTGMIIPVAHAMADESNPLFVDTFNGLVICSPQWKSEVEEAISGTSNIDVIRNTENLAELLSEADLVVSAAGTSSWEYFSMGIPSVLIKVVENQARNLSEINAYGLAECIDPGDLTHTELVREVRKAIARLLESEKLRAKFSKKCLRIFDGHGAKRVVDQMERFFTMNLAKG
jgi:UDP-2,4-diacetamido-2,4,6-trideoxy-beta-L-altropyranose hydrolase